MSEIGVVMIVVCIDVNGEVLSVEVVGLFGYVVFDCEVLLIVKLVSYFKGNKVWIVVVVLNFGNVVKFSNV